MTKIEGAYLGQKITLCAFLDVEGAFHITYISIERADTSKGMDLAIMVWIKAMLSTCRVMAHLGEVAEIAVAYRCHQRSLQVRILLTTSVVDVYYYGWFTVRLYDAGYTLQVMLTT